jgi:hypothetical protein
LLTAELAPDEFLAEPLKIAFDYLKSLIYHLNFSLFKFIPSDPVLASCNPGKLMTIFCAGCCIYLKAKALGQPFNRFCTGFSTKIVDFKNLFKEIQQSALSNRRWNKRD